MNMKKLISMILCLGIVFSMCGFAHAAESSGTIDAELQERMLRVLASVETEREYYGLQDVDYSAVNIGEAIPSYKIDATGIQASDIKIYPILCNQNVVSFFYAAYYDGEWYVQLSNTLVKPITEATNNSKYAFIYDEDGAYIFDGNDISKIEGNISSKNAENTSILSLDDIKNSITTELGSMGLDSMLFCGDFVTSLDVYDFIDRQVVPYDSVPTYAYLPVQIIQQPLGTNICWAIALTSIINYIFKTNVTYPYVVDLITYGEDKGLYVEQVISGFNYHYNMDYMYQYTNGMDSYFAVLSLSSGYPIYADFTYPSSGAHAGTIRGANRVYNTFSVMSPSPNTNGYVAGTISNDNVWVFIDEYSGLLLTMRSIGYRAGGI